MTDTLVNADRAGHLHTTEELKAAVEAEREACAELCRDETAQARNNGCEAQAMGAMWCGKAIRARSEGEPE